VQTDTSFTLGPLGPRVLLLSFEGAFKCIKNVIENVFSREDNARALENREAEIVFVGKKLDFNIDEAW
jgi:hypothetical protein